jgi:hypothetical protein
VISPRPGLGLLAGVLAAVLILGAGLALVIRLDAGRAAPTLRATVSVAEALGGTGVEGFALSLPGRSRSRRTTVRIPGSAPSGGTGRGTSALPASGAPRDGSVSS